MINFDEKFWLTICFLIFILLIYKPLRNFFISLLDSNINKVKNDFNNAYDFLENSKIVLDKANKKLNQAVIEYNRVHTEIDKTISVDLQKINAEFEYHTNRLYLSNKELIEKLYNNYVKTINNQIVVEAIKKIETNHNLPKLQSSIEIEKIIKSI